MNEQEKAFFMKEWGDNPAVHMEVHKAPCKWCPSMKGNDPESDDLLALPFELRRLTVFPCAWRTEKVCKGYADKCGVTG